MQTKKIYLYTSIAGFALGVAIASLYSIPLFFIGIAGGVAVVSIVAAAISRWKFLICLAIFVSLFSAGLFRFYLFDVRHVPDTSLENKKISIEAKVVSIPKKENGKVVFIVKPEPAFAKATAGKGNIRVSTGGIEVKRGDIVHLEGKIALPENFETETGREFQYVRYLKKDNVLYQLSFATVKVVSRPWSFAGTFGTLHDLFLKRINQAVSYPESSLIAGILIGAESDIPRDVEDNFRNVGLVHIMVLSGYNISIVIRFVDIFSGKFHRLAKIIVDLTFVFIFVCFVGATATVVRAGIMAALANVSAFTFRKQSTLHILIVAGFFMVVHNPFILMFDPSFQLSFLATAGLVILATPFGKLLSKIKIPNFIKVRETVATSLATQVFVLPLIIYLSGIVSPVSLLVNIVVLPLMPAVMLLGFLSSMVQFVSTTLALPFGYITSLLTSFILFISEYGASLPYSFFKITGVSGIAVLVTYGFIVSTILVIDRLRR